MLPLLALLASAEPASAAAGAGPRVGLVVYVAVNVDEAQTAAMSASLGRAIRKARPNVDVVAGEEVSRRMPPSGIAEDCLVKTACIRDVGKRLNADQLLFLVIARVGGRVQVDSTWADVATGRTVARDAVSFEGEAAREKAFAAAAPHLLPEPAIAAERQGNPKVGAIMQGPVAAAGGRRITGAVVVAVGLGTAALVGGFAVALGTRDDYNALVDAGCNPRRCDTALLDRVESRSLYANILFGTAALAGASAVLFYLASGERSVGGVSLGVSHQGVTVGGQF